jgi:hypothetical protein
MVCASTGAAQAQFFLEQGKVSLAVSAGERTTNSFVISNTTDQSIAVRTYWEDFDYKPPYDGSKAFLPAGTGTFSASGWVEYSPGEFTLPPYGKQTIDYVVTVPASLDGGHYGVLFFERAGDPIKDATGVQIVTRVGSLFFFEPKDAPKKAEVVNIKAVDGKITGDFVNQCQVILIPKMTYYVMDPDGLVADRGEVKKLYVPPGATGSWEIALPAGLSAGQFTLVLNTDLEGGTVVVKEIDFVKDAAGSLLLGTIRD